MMSYSNSLVLREAGSLINRPVTFRTIPRFWHPRTGITAFLLLLSTTTELVVLNLIPQHDPQSDSELASHGHTRLPQTLLLDGRVVGMTFAISLTGRSNPNCYAQV